MRVIGRWTRAVAACALLAGACAWAQAPATGDARALLAEAIAVLRAAPSMGGEPIDWTAAGERLGAGLAPGAAPGEAHRAIAEAVALLNDPHARFVAPAPPVNPAKAPAHGDGQGAAPESGAPSVSEPAAHRPAVPTRPEGRMLEEGIAYVVVPMCAAPGVDGLRAYAQELRATLARLAKEEPKGWALELRFNGGGNVWPMLLGLQPLLGDGGHATSVVGAGVTQVFGCTGNEAWLETDGKREVQLALPDAPPAEPIRGPVAALIGPWTMSSGEMIALAFKGRARLMGEPTAGLTTVTYPFPLSDGSTLSLPTSRMGDRDGVAANGAIEPDEAVAIGEWPTAEDEVACAAARWVSWRRGEK